MATIGWLTEQWLHNIDSNVSSNGNVRIDSINHNGTNLRITGIMAITMRGPSSSYYGYYVYGAYGTPKSGGEQKILENNQKVYSGNYASKSFDVTIPNVAASATSAEFTCRFRDGKSQFFDKTLKWTINFDASGTAPTITGLSVTSRTYNSFTANTTISNWGSGGDRTFRVLKVLKEQYSAGKDALGKQSYNSSTSAVSLTVSRASADDIVGTAFDIKGASKYYLGIYADNGTKDSRFADTTQYATPPAPLSAFSDPTYADSTAGKVTATFTMTGGNTTLNSTNTVTNEYRYSTNNGSSYSSWTSAGTGTPQTSKSFTITVPAGSQCIVQARQTYEGQASTSSEKKFTAPIYHKAYGSVNSKAVRFKNGYVSVNGAAKPIKKVYASVNGKAKRIF